MCDTPVKILKIRLTKTDIELHDIKVYNPAVYNMQPALSIHKIVLKMTPLNVLRSFLGLHSTIRKVTVIDPAISIEMTNPSGSQNNWVELLTNMKNSIDKAVSNRLFHMDTIVFRDVAIEIKNKALYKRTWRPHSIYSITMTQNQDAPQPSESLIYWSTKLALEQIGQTLEQPDFTNAIKSLSPPQTLQNPLSISPKN